MWLSRAPLEVSNQGDFHGFFRFLLLSFGMPNASVNVLHAVIREGRPFSGESEDTLCFNLYSWKAHPSTLGPQGAETMGLAQAPTPLLNSLTFISAVGCWLHCNHHWVWNTGSRKLSLWPPLWHKNRAIRFKSRCKPRFKKNQNLMELKNSSKKKPRILFKKKRWKKKRKNSL